jgi:YVTN family beta-propeller protein
LDENVVLRRFCKPLLDQEGSRDRQSGGSKGGAHQLNVAITPNGASAYVADAGANSVTMLGTTTNTVVATVGVGAIPVDVSISPDGSHAYVTNAGAKSVSVIAQLARSASCFTLRRFDRSLCL